MLLAILALQIVLCLLAVVLLLRRRAPADPRQAYLPDQLTRLDLRGEAFDNHARDALAHMRDDINAEAHRTREAAATDFTALRGEVLACIHTLGTTLHTGMATHRGDNAAAAENLRATLQDDLTGMSHRLGAFMGDAARHQIDARDALHTRLGELGASHATQQEKLRAAVEDRLEKLNTTNAAKLEEMRLTVDEKLHATLHTRLTESFGLVADQLNKVHSGLGEMSKLSDGVSDLSRIFTNVKSRGGFAEVQLGLLLEQMLAPSQFARNVRVKSTTQELVEFAVRFPGQAGETLLPIDAKFPREAWERLENAYESGSPDEIASAGRVFEAAIRTEGKRICEKYINPPVTTPHAIMFLPTEGLYAEVMRRDSLQAEIQSKCQVTIAGPSTLSAILTSFQMGFHMLAIQEKGDQVWKVLEGAKREFGTFETLMSKMEKQVGTVQNTILDLGVRTRAINRTLREVSTADGPSNLIAFDDRPEIAPLLAAVGEND